MVNGEPVRLVVIDDMPAERHRLSALMEDWALMHQLPYDLYTGQSSDDAYRLLTNETALAVLDVQLSGGSAIEAVEALRNKGFLGDVIFVTAYPVALASVANVQPFGFVDKCQPAEVFAEAFTAILDKWLRRCEQRFFRYTFNKSSYMIAYNNIIYFENKDRKVMLHLVNGDAPAFYGSFKNLMAVLDKRIFLPVGKKYLVNIRHVQRLTQKELILSNQIRLHFSSYMQKQLEDALLSIGLEAEE